MAFLCTFLCVHSSPFSPHAHIQVRPWDSPGKNTRVGCHILLQGIFSTQGSYPALMFPALAGGFFTTSATYDFPRGSDGKESACDAGDQGSIPGLGSSSGEDKGNPLQYSCLENPRDRGTWRATVHGVAKSRTRLSD